MFIDDNNIILVLGYASIFGIGIGIMWGLLLFWWRI
jgi:hypothetical protein